ncbi:MAG: zinc metallopeptidase [Verrucomicrobiae bacterium]|nr:zinc metallopeptidase [Verrucomicrobiae bacterium]MCB1090438.1 zinc metallopeptidase [Verrucomicrobiae bacterium]
MTWILLFGGTLLLSFLASARVKSAVSRYSQYPVASGLSGAEAAQQILSMAGINQVEIVCQDGFLGDHYDPVNKRLVLSRENFYGRSVSALGIAAHESGHAIQDKVRYAPLTWRMASVGAVNFVSPMLYIVPLVAAFGLIAPKSALMIMALAFGVLMLFQLITLPVEYDASRRAKVILGQTGMISPGEESDGVNRVLNAAALTYVAAFISTLGWFLYYVLPLILGGNRD